MRRQRFKISCAFLGLPLKGRTLKQLPKSLEVRDKIYRSVHLNTLSVSQSCITSNGGMIDE
jgi:hypothetical protein